MDSEQRQQHFHAIAQNLRQDLAAEPVTVRELIGLFNAQRRGANVSWDVRKALGDAGLKTVPPFEGVHIDGRVEFAIAEAEQGGAGHAQEPAAAAAEDVEQALEPAVVNVFVGGAGAEPAYRVSRLLDPKRQLIFIGPDSTLEEAATMMLRHDYSQLPVMTNERNVRGVVSWDSIGPAMVLRHTAPIAVRECMRQHVEVKTTDSIFQVINKVIENSYVLVRDERQVIVDILTTTDLSQQFQDLAEPFLLLGDIENHIRSLIDARFTQQELEGARNENDPGRAIASVGDLTLGEHARLIQNPDNWERLKLRVDRTVFSKELEVIRKLRNDVMHFESDRMTDEERGSLRKFVQFLHQLKAYQPPPAR